MAERHQKKKVHFVLNNLSVIVLGASGDLSKRKIFPALFNLYRKKVLPKTFRIFGYARSDIDCEELKKRTYPFCKNIYSKSLLKVNDFDEKYFHDELNGFFSNVIYYRGLYDNKDDFIKLNELTTKLEKECEDKPYRLFYFSLPPHIFLKAARNIGKTCKLKDGINRILLEKPFGRNVETYEKLHKEIMGLFELREVYRIDHYIGKEVVQNLIALRFANVIFDSLWSRQVIKNVQIVFKEELGVEGRGGYFDEFGIIRDVMQNHMMQILTYIAMEPPCSFNNRDIVAEKMKVLKCIEPLKSKDCVIGQYKRNKRGSPGYRDDESIKKINPFSNTETFCACVLYIKNRRWDNVPFMLKAGKALDESLVEIRIKFQTVPANIFHQGDSTSDDTNNELVIRVQPDESIYFTLQNKIPGLKYQLAPSKLDFTYQTGYKKGQINIPDAYERLILNCIEGDDSNFVHPEELKHSWEIFDGLLKDIEGKKIKNVLYPLGSRGPVDADYLAAKCGQKWSEDL